MPESAHTYCTDIAIEHGVPLLGSATTGDVWLLVEYRGRWANKAFEESHLPESVKAHLNAVQPEGLQTRILMIQQTESKQREGVRMFVGITDPKNPRLYAYDLQDYDEILQIDLAGLASGGDDPSHRRETPLFLVCANGKRDACCAHFGPLAYRALSVEYGEAVWKSSHIGGHNKAPNLLFFPDGVNYGRAKGVTAAHLAEKYQHGLVDLDYLRGRVCYPVEVQAAAHFWREETGVLDLPGLEVTAVEQLGEDKWRVAIRGLDETEPRWIGVRREESEEELPISCAGDKLKPYVSFRRVEKV